MIPCRLAIPVILVLLIAGVQATTELQLEAFSALESATRYFRTVLSCRGGYLGEYSEDLSVWIGEGTESPQRIWIQPPGTPRIGLTFLRAYEATGDERYLEAATAVADALIWGQLETGGWDYVVDFLGEDRWRYRHEGAVDQEGSDTCVFDDNVSQEAIRLLMAVDGVLGRDPYHDAVLYALEFMMESQFENGAWPQKYPLTGSYPDYYQEYYTFNDRVINDCISVMMEAYQRYGDERYLRSAEMGGSFIIISQIEEPQGGWAQQYLWNLTPAWARAFEPPAVCSAVTGRNIITLLDLYLYTGNETYLTPIPSAIDWLNRSTIGEELWARFYELGTNRPIYGDRDGQIHYELSEISEERRRGYSWNGSYGRSAMNMYGTVMARGREGYIADRDRNLTPAEMLSRASGLETRVRNAIDTLDAEGRWVDNGWIYSKTFNRQAGYLIDYLHYSGWNVTVPVPALGPFTGSVNGAEVTVRVGVGDGQPSRVYMRFTPPTLLTEYELRDDGQLGDEVPGDSVYTLTFQPDDSVATRVHMGVVVAVDGSGHWNLTAVPAGTMAAASLALVELENGLGESQELGADTTAIEGDLAGIMDALEDVGPDLDLEGLLGDMESMLLEVESLNVARLIEIAGDLIEEAEGMGIDTSRHRIFLDRAMDHWESGNYGPARQFIIYPMGLKDQVPEGLLASILLPALLVGLGRGLPTSRSRAWS